MKALTICQPYAFAILEGVKRVENRSWPIPYRGPLAIHAGKSRDYMGDLTDEQWEVLHGMIPEKGLNIACFGAIVGLVDVIGCLSIDEYQRRFPGDIWAFGDWCHVYANPRKLKTPIPWRGQLGVFEIPDEIIKEAIYA
jgi:hypothetical protein